MIIYIILLVYIFLLPVITKPLVPNFESRQKWIAFLGLAAVFLVFALKAPTVGIDIPGYREQYYLSKSMPWSDFSYVYFENGYIFLEKLFSKMGFDFQLFTVLIYFTECLALFLLISKFSQDATLSLLIFICYQMFVFSMSGLRQVISISICIFAYLLFYKRRWFTTIIGLTLIVAAITIHTSAYVFFLIPLLMFLSDRVKSISLILLGILLLFSALTRTLIWRLINTYMKSVDVGTQITLGGNFLFLVLVMIFCLYTYESYYGLGYFGKKRRTLLAETPVVLFEDTMCVRIVELCVIGNIVMSGASLLRAVSYFTIILVPLLPGMFNKYRKGQSAVMRVVFVALLLYLFIQSLVINQLHFSHYMFFWE